MDDFTEKLESLSRSYYWKRIGFLRWECWVRDGADDRRVFPVRFLTWGRAAEVSNAIFEAYNDGADNQRKRDRLAREKAESSSEMVTGSHGLRDLALRCMRTLGPDLELNALVEVAVGRADQIWNDVFVSMDSGAVRSARDYTGSMDVAISLLPKGWVVLGLGQYHDLAWYCDVRGPVDSDSEDPIINTRACTPALALVAAALEARATENDRE